MAYVPFHADWHDKPATDTPITAAFLEYIESYLASLTVTVTTGTGAVLVASTDAPAAVKAVADFVCDGTADQVQIQSAVDLAAALTSRNSQSPAGAQQRGKVQLSGGRFNLSGAVKMHTGVWVAGMGPLTECRAVSNNDTGLFTLNVPEAHLCWVSDMYLEGNGSSGGSCSGVYFDMTDATPDTTSYPNSDPDADHHVWNLFIHEFMGASGRNGIAMVATGSSNSRGQQIHDCQIRRCTGSGVLLDGASDAFVHDVHTGGANIGFNIASGNIRVDNCKAYYSDTTAFNFTGSRVTASNLECQDSATGYILSSSNGNYANITADTCSTDGIKITTGCQVQGAVVYMRGGGRYSTLARGFNIGSGLANLFINGTVYPSSITTPISGTAHASQAAGKILNGTSTPFVLG